MGIMVAAARGAMPVDVSAGREGTVIMAAAECRPVGVEGVDTVRAEDMASRAAEVMAANTGCAAMVLVA